MRTLSVVATFSILVGVAKAQWGAATDLGTSPGYPWWNAWCDLNGDQRLDLISAASNAGFPMRVQLAQVGGSFSAPIDYAVSGSFGPIATGDANNDGRNDVAIATSNPFGIDVLLGNGTGGLLPPIHVASLYDYYSAGIALGDVNGDGLPDVLMSLGLAVINGQYLSATKVAVFSSTGPSAWSLPTYVTVGVGPQPIVLADLDHDGDLDFVTGDSTSLTLGWNNGSGSFTPTMLASGAVAELRIVDIDLDGEWEIVDALASSGVLEVRHGLGGGTFAPPQPYPTSIANRNLVCSDVDGDGWKDAVISDWVNATVAVLHGTPAGGFGAASTITTGSAGRLAVFDSTGDGRLDIVVAGRYRNASTGTFAPVYAYCTPRLSSHGCSANITYSGVAHASGAGNFLVRALQTPSQVNGIFFYGLSGASLAPFHGSTLCVAAPLYRTPLQNSGGSTPPGADCSGVTSIAFATMHANGPAALHVPGTAVNGQFWMRDVGAPPLHNTTLSDAVRFVVQP